MKMVELPPNLDFDGMQAAYAELRKMAVDMNIAIIVKATPSTEANTLPLWTVFSPQSEMFIQTLKVR